MQAGDRAEPLGGGPRTAEELAALEARYVPFVDFRSCARVHVDEPRWMRYVGVLGRRSGAAEEAVRRDVEDRLLRAAALDSAALDGLLAANPELTTAVLSSSIHPGEAISAVQESVRLVAECNYRALVLVREAAQEGRIVDEPFIALLFDVITESQATYTVTDEEGAVVEVELPRRQYKPVTNYLRHPDGLRVFAPASRVPEEMGRLAAELASAEFQHAHPAVQAAYAHYALTVVHPFADANGRLARAAASVYLLRAIGVPLLVFADQWPSYYQAVSAADGGDFQRLTDAVAAFAMAAIELKANLLATRAEAGLTMHPRAVAAPQSPASVPEQAARTLLDVLWVELREALVSPPPGLRLALGETHELPVGYAEPVYRVVADPATGAVGVRLALRGDDAPSAARDLEFLALASPLSDDLLPVSVRETRSGELLEFTLDDTYPFALEGTVLRVRAWIDHLVADALAAVL